MNKSIYQLINEAASRRPTRAANLAALRAAATKEQNQKDARKAELEALLSKEDDMDMDADEMDKHWMKLAVEEAEKAMQNGEIPIAAILVADGKELSRSQTMVSRKGTMAAHGELFALLEANGKIWTAPHPLVIYTNLEPCLMCVGAAMQVGVDEIVFGMRAAPDGGARYSQAIAEGGQKPPRIRGGVLEMETVALMRKLIEVNPQQPALPYVKAMLEPYKGL